MSCSASELFHAMEFEPPLLSHPPHGACEFKFKISSLQELDHTLRASETAGPYYASYDKAAPNVNGS